MLAALALAVLLVAVVDRFHGHSSLAFAAAIILLMVANAPMLRFNCARDAAKNAFFAGSSSYRGPTASAPAAGRIWAPGMAKTLMDERPAHG